MHVTIYFFITGIVMIMHTCAYFIPIFDFILLLLYVYVCAHTCHVCVHVCTVCMYVMYVYMYVYMCTSCIQNLFLLLHVQHVYPFVFLNSLVSALRYSTSSVAATLINTMGTPTIIRIRVARIIVAVTVDVAHTKRLRRAIQKLRKMH